MADAKTVVVTGDFDDFKSRHVRFKEEEFNAKECFYYCLFSCHSSDRLSPSESPEQFSPGFPWRGSAAGFPQRSSTVGGATRSKCATTARHHPWPGKYPRTTGKASVRRHCSFRRQRPGRLGIGQRWASEMESWEGLFRGSSAHRRHQDQPSLRRLPAPCGICCSQPTSRLGSGSRE